MQAVVDDLDIPGQYPEVRAVLEADRDTAALYAQLVELDPVAAGRMEPTNRRRIVRALEVTMGSGRRFSSYGPGLDAHPPTEFTMVGAPTRERRPARPDRGPLRAADERRVPRRGAAAPRRRPAASPAPPGQALGYKELLDHLDGALTLDEALDLAIRRTGRFARRQRAWFRRDPRIAWLDADARRRRGTASWSALRALVG